MMQDQTEPDRAELEQSAREIARAAVLSGVWGMAVLVLGSLLGALFAQQTVRFERPPAHEYVLRATVPGMRPPLTIPGVVTDSRLILTLEDGTPISEIVAEVPAGTSSVAIVPGRVAGQGALGPLLRLMGDPRLAVLVIDPDGPGGQPDARFPLTDASAYQSLYRAGRVLVTARFHRDLGQYGGLEWWISAHGRQLDVEMLWHRASVGPDVVFREARVEVMPGAAWTPSIPDPACAPPALVRARPAGHRIPQQMGRPFFFSIHAAGEQPEPERIGVADWSGGGFMPSGFPVPTLPAHDWAGQLAEARSKLANLQPTEPWEPAPTDWLWPASGVQTGGAGGGIDRYPLDGVRWASSHGAHEALELYRIELLRNLSRARIRLDPDGSPLTLPSDGDWAFWDGFQDEGPWHWSAWPTVTSQWADHDTASMERRLNEAWVLVWLANDPLARLIALEGATRARLTFWEGRPLADSWGPGMGSSIGIWQGNAALAVAAARCMGATEYGPWRAAFLNHLRTVQMPSGCFTARLGGYPSDRAPFLSQYLLQGGQEFTYLALAAYSLGERDLVRRAVRGMVGIASDDGIHLWGEAPPGLYYFAPTGLVWPPGVRFQDETDWPWGLQWVIGEDPQGASYYAPWHMGIGVALAYATGAPEAPELLRRFAAGAGSMPANPGALLDSWGLVAPDDQANAPVENWWPIRRFLP